MQHLRPIRAIVLMASALALAACTDEAQQGARQAVADAKAQVDAATAEDGTVAKAMDEARRKLREENLPIGHEGSGPKAEITPQGDFLIDGKPLPLTDAQKAATRRFRDQTIDVAEAGMAMGQGGAALAGQALGAAMGGLLGADTSSTQQTIEAEAQKMKDAGLALCRKAQALDAAKDALAEALPEFRPYAETMKIDVSCEDEGGAQAPSAAPADAVPVPAPPAPSTSA